ncbi:MAG: DUF72 domain-containing protein [Halobacteriales archaeon]|nr:DUF72 domain-containing protein [Halobacteriales archaeon]
MRYRVGTTSWTYEDWQGPFYPPKTPGEERLARYARVFDTVECDATFYRMPSPEVTAKWAEATPSGFTMTVKLPRRITHDDAMVGSEDALRAFLSRIEPLRAAGKLGPVLAQFPPSFTRKKGDAAFEPFLDILPRTHRFAFEFRNKTWFVPETYDALRARGASLVWTADQQSHSPPELTADWLYVRLIGPDRAFDKFDRVQRDLRPVVEQMRDRLKERAARASEAFLFASNHFAGHGPATAAMLAVALGLPAPDLAAAKRGAQRGLADFA